MNPNSYQEAIAAILEKDPRYHAEAYDFVREGLDFTIKRLKKPTDGPERHISGGELMGGLRDYALQEYGPMSLPVLAKWGIHQTDDAGQIVFNLVEAHILGKTDEDSPEDFVDLFDFREAFVSPFLPAGGQEELEQASQV